MIKSIVVGLFLMGATPKTVPVQNNDAGVVQDYRTDLFMILGKVSDLAHSQGHKFEVQEVLFTSNNKMAIVTLVNDFGLAGLLFGVENGEWAVLEEDFLPVPHG